MPVWSRRLHSAFRSTALHSARRLRSAFRSTALHSARRLHSTFRSTALHSARRLHSAYRSLARHSPAGVPLPVRRVHLRAPHLRNACHGGRVRIGACRRRGETPRSRTAVPVRRDRRASVIQRAHRRLHRSRRDAAASDRRRGRRASARRRLPCSYRRPRGSCRSRGQTSSRR